MNTAPTSLPVALSYARNIAPRGRSSVVVNCDSPRTTRVLVMTRPTLAPCPLRGMVLPFSSAWFRTTSGVSPCGTRHLIAPLSRSIAASTLYGGFTIDSPCTVRPPPPSPPPPPPPPRPCCPCAVAVVVGGAAAAPCVLGGWAPRPAP